VILTIMSDGFYVAFHVNLYAYSCHVLSYFDALSVVEYKEDQHLK